MSVWGWVAFGLGVANALLWAAVVVAARRLWVKIKPMVEPYLMMFGGMLSPAAGTGGIGNVATSSPAAIPDRCEYEDHVWSAPQPGALTGEPDFHYCTRCGFKEPLPGQ